MTNHIRVAFRIPRRAVTYGATLFTGGLLFSAAAALAVADNDPSTQSVIGAMMIVPYDGFLMLDSKPVDGTARITFELYDEFSGSRTALWTETQTVTAYQGRFSVGLGSSTPIGDTILDAEQLYLGMTIIETDANGNDVSIALGGRQAIEAAPYAAWAANSADMKVAGTLSVEEGAGIIGADNDGTDAALKITSTIGGSTQTMLLDGNEIDAPSTGGLYLQNNTDADVNVMSDMVLNGAFKPGYAAWAGSDTGDGNAAIVNDNGTFQALMITGNTSAGGDRVVKVWDHLGVNSSIFDHSGDTLTVDDHLHVSGNDLELGPNADRALVYSSTNDQLIVNFNADSPGGVQIGGTGSSTTSGKSSLRVTGSLRVDGDVDFNGDLTRDCPGSPKRTVTSQGAKLCVYSLGGGSNTDYDGVSERCWDNYGAELCTYNQLQIAVKDGLSLSSSLYMRDMVADDTALETNRTGTSTNFEGTIDTGANRSGAYCCRIMN